MVCKQHQVHKTKW